MLRRTDNELRGANESIHTANRNYLQHTKIIQDQVAEKNRLLARLAQQQRLLEQLTQKVGGLESEKRSLTSKVGELESEKRSLTSVTNALKEANWKHSEDVAGLNASNQSLKQEHEQLLRTYNRNLVFMNLARQTLEELTEANTPEAENARFAFAKNYEITVTRALACKSLKEALHLDPSFERDFPKAHHFISKILMLTEPDDPPYSGDLGF